MKITKQQLKQIIKEELDATMDEGLENVTPENIQIAVEAFKDCPFAGHITLVKGERSKLASYAAEVL